MHQSINRLAVLGLSLTHLTISAPPFQRAKRIDIPAGTGMSLAGSTVNHPSNQITAVMRTLNDWETISIEGDCSPAAHVYEVNIQPDTPEAFQQFVPFAVSKYFLPEPARMKSNVVRNWLPMQQSLRATN